jgi:hypothetical protein
MRKLRAATRGLRGKSMRVFIRLLLGCAMLALAPSPATAGGSVTVHILNDTVDSLIVSLYDRNLGRRQPVLSGQVINGNGSISITINANASGQGHLSWTATTVDTDMRRCGRHDNPGLNDGDTVRVYASARCPARRRK